jgi:hypothetical protein
MREQNGGVLFIIMKRGAREQRLLESSSRPRWLGLLLLAAALTTGHARTRVLHSAAAGGTARCCSRARANVSAKLSTNPFAYSFGLQEPELELPGSPAPDTPPEHFSIAQAQIDALKRDGVVHIPAVLSAAWLEYMRLATQWQIEHPHFWASPGVASGLYDRLLPCL